MEQTVGIPAVYRDGSCGWLDRADQGCEAVSGSYSRELILPWPARALHPNSRGHWSRRAKAVKAARYEAGILTLRAGWQAIAWPAGRLHVWINAYPPDRRRRDTDGVLSSLKAALDGIADTIGIDDRRFVPHPYLHDEPRKAGEVRIRITGES